jgi:hypothetical protein
MLHAQSTSGSEKACESPVAHAMSSSSEEDENYGFGGSADESDDFTDEGELSDSELQARFLSGALCSFDSHTHSLTSITLYSRARLDSSAVRCALSSPHCPHIRTLQSHTLSITHSLAQPHVLWQASCKESRGLPGDPAVLANASEAPTTLMPSWQSTRKWQSALVFLGSSVTLSAHLSHQCLHRTTLLVRTPSTTTRSSGCKRRLRSSRQITFPFADRR